MPLRLFKVGLYSVLVLIAADAFGQAGVYLLDPFAAQAYERKLLQQDVHSHHGVWPIIERDLLLADSSADARNRYLRPVFESASQGDGALYVAPLLDLSGGYSSQVGALYTTAAGAQVTWKKGSKWSLFGEVYGGLERAPAYINRFVDSLGVLPGLGRNRGQGDMLAFVLPTFAASFAPSRHFQVDVGFGNHRFGGGYRSLMLSDAAYNYPYLKITTDVWRFKYVNLFSALTHIGDEAAAREQFEPKYMASHYLSWAITRRITFSVFESVIWQGRDSLSQRSFDPHYLNPVIYYRPVEFAMGSPDRMLVGAELSVQLGKKSRLYGQFVLDEFLLDNLRERNGWWANKWGVQAGGVVYDALGIEGLRLQAEVNVVRPFTYSHGSVVQNYAHFNQPLAHPLGSNFYEGLLLIDYQRGDWFASSHSMATRFGRDDSLNFGGDLFRSYVNPALQFGNTIAQGLQHDVVFQRITVGRVIDKRTDLRVALRYTYRAEWVGERPADVEHFVGLHVSTGIRNRQRDF